MLENDTIDIVNNKQFRKCILHLKKPKDGFNKFVCIKPLVFNVYSTTEARDSYQTIIIIIILWHAQTMFFTAQLNLINFTRKWFWYISNIFVYIYIYILYIIM